MKPHAAAPVIETERLILRGFEPQDFEPYHAMWSEPEVLRYTSGVAKTKRESWTMVLRHFAQWQWLGYGYWAVLDKASGKFIGEMGIGDFRRELPFPLTEPEPGWILTTSNHGKGIGYEACQAIMAWADANLELPKTSCLISPNNLPSMRLAQKLGFVEVHRFVTNEKPWVIMHRQRQV